MDAAAIFKLRSMIKPIISHRLSCFRFASFGVTICVAFAVSSRRDARDNGSLLTYKPMTVAHLSDSKLTYGSTNVVGIRLGRIAWDRDRSYRLINGRIALLVPDVRFARGAIKSAPLAVSENCDCPDASKDCSETKFSGS